MHRSFDVSDIAAGKAFAAEAEAQLGPIDILFNNAGMNIRKPFEAYTEADFDRIFAVHMKGMFFMAQAVYPGMIARGRGCIINVASQRGLKGRGERSTLFRRQGCDHGVHPVIVMGGCPKRRAGQRGRTGTHRHGLDGDHGPGRPTGLHRCSPGRPIWTPRGNRSYSVASGWAGWRVLRGGDLVPEWRRRDVLTGFLQIFSTRLSVELK